MKPVSSTRSLTHTRCVFSLKRTDTHFVKGNYPKLVFHFELKRSILYFILETYVPSSLLVVLSWVSFWISLSSVPARICIGGSQFKSLEPNLCMKVLPCNEHKCWLASLLAAGHTSVLQSANRKLDHCGSLVCFTARSDHSPDHDHSDDGRSDVAAQCQLLHQGH